RQEWQQKCKTQALALCALINTHKNLQKIKRCPCGTACSLLYYKERSLVPRKAAGTPDTCNTGKTRCSLN
ncbi:MAG: hypothetical protein RR075_02665, partial [Pygmaiobacter sp.]